MLILQCNDSIALSLFFACARTPRYDRNKFLLKEVYNVQYVSCMNPTAGSFTINPRLQVHLHTECNIKNLVLVLFLLTVFTHPTSCYLASEIKHKCISIIKQLYFCTIRSHLCLDPFYVYRILPNSRNVLLTLKLLLGLFMLENGG